MPGIERIHRPTRREFFENWVIPGKPVLLTGLMDAWPAMGKWTPEFFARIGGERKTRIEFGNVLQDAPRFEEWELGRYINHILHGLDPNGGPVPYLAYFDIFKFFPELRADVDFSFWKGRIRFPIGWIGPAGSYTGLHYDIAPNLFAQFHGSKEFLLYPPSQTACMYPSRRYDIGSVLSDVDARKPDYHRYPRFREAQGMEAVVEPGQMLFTPRGWWHQVRGLEMSISVSCFGFSIADTLLRGIPGAVKHALHGMGWYRKGECACHMTDRIGATHDRSA